MSQAERRQLARVLAKLDARAQEGQTQEGQTQEGQAQESQTQEGLTQDRRAQDGPGPDTRANPYQTDPQLRRQRRLALFVSAACCVILAGWIVVLAATLPRHFDAHHWRAVWVNFDVFLFAAFMATAWAIWRERQVLILLLAGIGTMLCCDAWFDVGTSLATSGLWISLLTAAFAELPLAFLAFAGARRLLQATVEASLQVPAVAATRTLEATPAGMRGPAEEATPSLRRTPLSGHGLDEALPRGRAHRPA
jgi:cation transport ATPase